MVIQSASFKSELEAIRRRLRALEEKEPKPEPQRAPPPLPAWLKAKTPPPASAPSAPSQPPPRPASVQKPVAKEGMEMLVGVKLSAFVGGLAFFLGVVFFVKYAFDRNLITPAMRIAIGAAVGIALVVIGALASRKRYRVPAQSLCATGFLILYADVYAAHVFYQLASLRTASILMCVVTLAALALATVLEAQVAVWLAAIGGFLTPVLLWQSQGEAWALFGYIAVLNSALSVIATWKRWPHFIAVAALGTVVIELAWFVDFFGPVNADSWRLILLLLEAEFLLVCLWRTKRAAVDQWCIAAVAATALVAMLIAAGASANYERYRVDFAFPIFFFANAGLLGALALAQRRVPGALRAISVSVALMSTWGGEWAWRQAVLSGSPLFGIIWYGAILLLFSGTPQFFPREERWPWAIAAIAGPLQFVLVYSLFRTQQLDFPQWLLPLIFALLPVANAAYLRWRLRVPLAAGDGRLAMQIASVIFFVSLVFPIQFEREWLTLAWALEAVGLLLLYRALPNAQLRYFALLLLAASFVRLALNPAVLEYHPLTAVPIWNWFLYAYGICALCCFLAAWLYPKGEKLAPRATARGFLITLGTILLFLLLNIEIADYFSLGPTLTFDFSSNFASDMSYSIAWALFAFVLLIIGIWRKARAPRYAALGLLLVTLLKLFVHDLARLKELYRVGAFLGVAVVLIIASFVYQRFLSPREVQ
ncbi:MAG: DUF2339 domain-containing protein [Verrucomicrobiota bacterium]|nr:DUF2339 domain-containing protein [Verrucomicrobiota bacterium]